MSRLVVSSSRRLALSSSHRLITCPFQFGPQLCLRRRHRIQYILCSHKTRHQRTRHRLLVVVLEPPARAVARQNDGGRQRLQVGDRRLHFRRVVVRHVEATHDGVQGLCALVLGREARNSMPASIHHACVAAPRKHDQPFALEPARHEPLVLDQGVGRPLRRRIRVAHRAANAALVAGLARDLARHPEEAVPHRMRLGVLVHDRARRRELGKRRIRLQGNGRPAGELHAPEVGAVGVDVHHHLVVFVVLAALAGLGGLGGLCRNDGTDSRFEPARVVPVPVRQVDDLDATHVGLQARHVPRPHGALRPGVKQERVLRVALGGRDQQRQAVGGTTDAVHAQLEGGVAAVTVGVAVLLDRRQLESAHLPGIVDLWVQAGRDGVELVVDQHGDFDLVDVDEGHCGGGTGWCCLDVESG
ncbi:uncharacterized protein SPSK_04265 [Sporothrix schenckii 1099-18]|uniref:Uncharacterized protein n=1 Tax=Sporothrix schenckii 1099-18 TaxID=1397361 RepID=A0A0F2M461_SPOSC|nr:uncharacterized protein SPSK_04265 [Sporothrix schenckii 1099-18]KJR83590.1 hypothetical protein SPSK_04265 [Sporothrix schenckii 1099-18]